MELLFSQPCCSYSMQRVWAYRSPAYDSRKDRTINSRLGGAISYITIAYHSMKKYWPTWACGLALSSSSRIGWRSEARRWLNSGRNRSRLGEMRSLAMSPPPLWSGYARQSGRTDWSHVSFIPHSGASNERACAHYHGPDGKRSTLGITK